MRIPDYLPNDPVSSCPSRGGDWKHDPLLPHKVKCCVLHTWNLCLHIWYQGRRWLLKTAWKWSINTASYKYLILIPHLTIQWHLSIKLTRLYLYFSNMCLICEQLRWKFWTISAKPNKGSGEIITPSYLSKWRKWRRQLSAPVVILKRVIKVPFTSLESEALPSHSFNFLVF